MNWKYKLYKEICKIYRRDDKINRVLRFALCKLRENSEIEARLFAAEHFGSDAVDIIGIEPLPLKTYIKQCINEMG